MFQKTVTTKNHKKMKGTLMQWDLFPQVLALLFQPYSQLYEWP